MRAVKGDPKKPVKSVKTADPKGVNTNLSSYEGFTTSGNDFPKEWNVDGNSAEEVMAVARAQHKAFSDKGYSGQPDFKMVSIKDPKTKKSFFRVYTTYGQP